MFYTQIPKLEYNISCKDKWMSNTNVTEIHYEVLFSLDYSPDITRDLSTHKWYIIFPTQFIVTIHTQEFEFIIFSKCFPINL